MIKLSIILPCYNVERYIADCLDSIYRQDIPEEEYEVICVDDCSKDNTVSIIKSYQKKHENIYLILHSVNKSVGITRNNGLLYVQGQYIWFVDPDDILCSNVFSYVYHELSVNKLDLLLFNYFDADEMLHIYHRYGFIRDSLVMKGMDYCEFALKSQLNKIGLVWAKCFSRDFLMNNGIRFPRLLKSEDVVFVWKTLFLAKRIKAISEAIYIYRNHPNSVTHVTKNSQILYNERYMYGVEVVHILHDAKYNLPYSVRNQLLQTCQWCSNPSYKEIMLLSHNERYKFYQLTKLSKEKIRCLYSYMSRKNKIIFTYGINYYIWYILIKIFFLTHR